MASNPETVLTNKIRKAVAAEWPQAFVVKIGTGYQTAGIPDLLVCLDGKFIGLEVKCQRPGESIQHARERVTPRQHQMLYQIHLAGGTSAVVVTVEEALSVLRSCT